MKWRSAGLLIRSAGLLIFASLALAVVMGVDAAPGIAASRPVWQVNAESIPTNLPPGGTGEYLLHVRNLGTVPTDGSTVTVVDRLPAGVIATSAGSEIEEGEGVTSDYWMCSGTTVVTCTNTVANMPTIAPGGERTQGRREVPTAPLIAIDVAVAPAATSASNVVSVSGGGATEAKSSVETTIAPSPAGFGLQSFEQIWLGRDGSPETTAGVHPYEMFTSLSFTNPGRESIENVSPSGEVKDLEVGLPMGLVGNPTATPRCSRAAFDNGRLSVEGRPECPADTQVGTATLAIGNPFFALVLPVYNLEPPADVPAQFGFAFQYRVGFINAGIRNGEGNGLKVVLKNIAQLHILRTALTLWGVPADPSHDIERGSRALEGGVPVASDSPEIPLLTNPTSCHVPLANLISADSWEQPTEPLVSFSYPFTAAYPVTDNQGNQLSIQDCS